MRRRKPPTKSCLGRRLAEARVPPGPHRCASQQRDSIHRHRIARYPLVKGVDHRVETTRGSGYNASRTSRDLPISREVIKLPTEGGIEDILHVPTITGTA